MDSLWATLAPLALGGAVVPIQVIVTILLLRSTHGRGTAVAWVGGMTLVRVLQGVLFGLVLTSDGAAADGAGAGPGPVMSTLLLVLAVLFLVMAGRQFLVDIDPDAPPPKWMTATETMAPFKAFALGVGLMLIGVKFWVFTLSAVGAIEDASLSRGASVAIFIIFVALSESAQLAVLGVAFVAPHRAEALLTAASAWLAARNRVIVIVLGAVFGSWFLVKALRGFGIL